MKNSNRFRQLLGLALLPVFIIAARPVGPSDGDEITLRWIKQAFDQPLDDPGALHDLAQHDRPRLGGQPIRSGLDAKGLVERGTEER